MRQPTDKTSYSIYFLRGTPQPTDPYYIVPTSQYVNPMLERGGSFYADTPQEALAQWMQRIGHERKFTFKTDGNITTALPVQFAPLDANKPLTPE